LFSDYPHYYRFKTEGKEEFKMGATRESENGKFIISSIDNIYSEYGKTYLGQIIPNFLGTKFELYDSGIDPAYISKESGLPKNFIPYRRKIAIIEYDSNFFAEKPRSFRISICDYEKNSFNINIAFENMAPKYNEARGCYTLNFFGRVNKASARNFQMILSDCDNDDDMYLTHGKVSKNDFNIDYRAPFN